MYLSDFNFSTLLLGLILPLSLFLAILRLVTEESLFFQDLKLEYLSLTHLTLILVPQAVWVGKLIQDNKTQHPNLQR